MTTVKVYNSEGMPTGEMTLPKALTVAWNPELVHQVMRAMQGNQRQTTAHTKDRSEVSGGGKKPWNQKGTGRARHGSIRSPLWKGGGVTFGPRTGRDYSQKINKKMLQRALASVLAQKAADGQFKVLEDITIEQPKTKLLARVMKNVIAGHSAMLVVPLDKNQIYRAARNLSRVKIVAPNQINVLDLLNHQDVVMEKTVLESYGE